MPELSTKELLAAAVASPVTSVAQGVVVEIGDEDYTSLIATQTDAELAKASQVAGIYWLVGDNIDHPIYKNPATQNLLFWIPGDQQGWYIASEYLEDHKAIGKHNGAAVFAWVGVDQFPGTIHVPYWAKKPLKAAGTGVKTVVDYHTARII